VESHVSQKTRDVGHPLLEFVERVLFQFSLFRHRAPHHCRVASPLSLLLFGLSVELRMLIEAAFSGAFDLLGDHGVGGLSMCRKLQCRAAGACWELEGGSCGAGRDASTSCPHISVGLAMLVGVWQAGGMKKQASDQAFHDRRHQERKRAEAARKVPKKKVAKPSEPRVHGT
jgi:hypothetical protein